MKKLIIFLVRKRLGLKKGEHFRFSNQASKHNTYYFTEDAVMKSCPCGDFNHVYKSSVSLNWLLDDGCEIQRVEEETK
jgi:hypothetical protein